MCGLFNDEAKQETVAGNQKFKETDSFCSIVFEVSSFVGNPVFTFFNRNI